MRFKCAAHVTRIVTRAISCRANKEENDSESAAVSLFNGEREREGARKERKARGKRKKGQWQMYVCEGGGDGPRERKCGEKREASERRVISHLILSL